MSITRVNTNARMSKIVKHNGTIYLSGQVAADPSGEIEQQTSETLARVEALLTEAGTDKQHILSTTIYLKDIANHFARMNSVWEAWVPEGHAPARACVQAPMARDTLLVEICVIAALPDA